MNKFVFGVAALSLAMSSLSFAGDHDQNESVRMRMDCRFRSESHLCLASATYSVLKGHYDAIADIQYGVSCDRQTIYNDGGTYMPQEQVSDGIRPRTSSVPRVQLYPQGALRNPGTYSATLDTELGQFMNGSCFVTRVWSGHERDQDQDCDQGQDHGQDQGGHQDSRR